MFIQQHFDFFDFFLQWKFFKCLPSILRVLLQKMLWQTLSRHLSNVPFGEPPSTFVLLCQTLHNARFVQTAQFCRTCSVPSSKNQEEEETPLKALNEQIENLKIDNEMLTDKYKRALADMENLRKRTQRQVEEAKLFAIQPFCKDLLEVADVLDLALNSLDKAKQSADGVPPVDSSGVHRGITMTKEVLMKTFKKHGLLPIRPEGQKFDPNMHEAVFEVPKDQAKQPAGHIARVLNIGYCLHDRPIRPAKVGVVKSD